MRVLLGFDPGGAGGFGWCIVEEGDRAPLSVLFSGVSEDAQDAFESVVQKLTVEMEVLAAGIDAPLFWKASGDRLADQTVRSGVKKCGAPSPGGTVQSVNSLRGACLVQGVMLGMLLRRRWPELPITESHPKAYLWLAGQANRSLQPRSIALASLPLFRCSGEEHCSEHVRDAVIATLSAAAMARRDPGWRDLLLAERDWFSPISEPLGYWMPDSADVEPVANADPLGDAGAEPRSISFSP